MGRCAGGVRMWLVGRTITPHFVILNLLQDNTQPQRVVLKQVQHDELLG
jgi:hypothetical protein